jgi:hypothetical protein
VTPTAAAVAAFEAGAGILAFDAGAEDLAFDAGAEVLAFEAGREVFALGAGAGISASLGAFALGPGAVAGPPDDAGVFLVCAFVADTVVFVALAFGGALTALSEEALALVGAVFVGFSSLAADAAVVEVFSLSCAFFLSLAAVFFGAFVSGDSPFIERFVEDRVAREDPELGDFLAPGLLPATLAGFFVLAGLGVLVGAAFLTALRVLEGVPFVAAPFFLRVVVMFPLSLTRRSV